MLPQIIPLKGRPDFRDSSRILFAGAHEAGLERMLVPIPFSRNASESTPKLESQNRCFASELSRTTHSRGHARGKVRFSSNNETVGEEHQQVCGRSARAVFEYQLSHGTDG